MKKANYKEITLPDREMATGTRICYNCCGIMNPCTYESTIYRPDLGAKVRVFGIQGHKCVVCEAKIWSSAEAKFVEREIQKTLRQEG